MNRADPGNSLDQVAGRASTGPVAEFRRWLIAAFFFAILGGCIEMVAAKYRPMAGQAILNVLFVGFWICFTAAEGWIQFRGTIRRLCWLVAGVLTVALLLSERPGPLSQVIPFFLVPAAIEFFTACKVRRRPWIWLIVTPILFGTAERWANTVTRETRNLMAFISGAFNLPMTVSFDVAGLAACFAVILIVRAAVGSFIASRKQVIPSPESLNG